MTVEGLTNNLTSFRIHSYTAADGALLASSGQTGRLVRTSTNEVLRLEATAGYSVTFVIYRNGVRYSGTLMTNATPCQATPPACSGSINSSSCCLIGTASDSSPRDLRVLFGAPAIGPADNMTEVVLTNRSSFSEAWLGFGESTYSQSGS
jgi:hypothetical protein